MLLSDSTFETHLQRSKEILEKLMDPEITMSESVTAFEAGMKELKAAQEMRNNFV